MDCPVINDCIEMHHSFFSTSDVGRLDQLFGRGVAREVKFVKVITLHKIDTVCMDLIVIPTVNRHLNSRMFTEYTSQFYIRLCALSSARTWQQPVATFSCNIIFNSATLRVNIKSRARKMIYTLHIYRVKRNRRNYDFFFVHLIMC